MISSRLLSVYRSCNVIRGLASKTKINKKKNSNKSVSKALAFPPIFERKLKRWPTLIQLEIDEYLKESGGRNNDKSILMRSSDLNYVDYHVDPFDGHVIEFNFAEDNIHIRKNFTKGTPIILIERGERINRYECVVIDVNPNGLFVKLRGRHGTIFNPVYAKECNYSIVPSEEFGTLKLLQEFLKQKDKWKNLPGYHILQYVYRAKPMKTIHHDRQLKYYLKLNEGQKVAVSAAMNNQRPIFCIQGPPGTGKSHILTEIILQANKNKQKVLICAPTHQAVNNLMFRVRNYVSNVHNASVTDKTTQSVNAAMKSHSDFDLLAQLYEEMENIKNTTQDIDLLQKVASKAANLNRQIKSAVLKSSNIIFTTLSSVSVRTLRLFGFTPDVVIIEEAGQAIECESWVALLQGRRAILAGDPSQLAVHLLSTEAVKEGLQDSLMKYVKKEFGNHSTMMLTEQYRMNEKIQNWSSNNFYEGRLKPNKLNENIKLSDISPIFEKEIYDPMVFINTDLHDSKNIELFDNDLLSYSNLIEAKLIINHIEKLIEGGLSNEEIGVITGYRNQVLLIRKMLQSKSIDKIDVSSVDGFQGEEREAIIMSFVRNNPNRSIGFLADTRRMNVAVTRAKRHFMLIGSAKMIESNDVLATLVKEFYENGIVLSPKEVLPEVLTYDKKYNRF